MDPPAAMDVDHGAASTATTTPSNPSESPPEQTVGPTSQRLDSPGNAQNKDHTLEAQAQGEMLPQTHSNATEAYPPHARRIIKQKTSTMTQVHSDAMEVDSSQAQMRIEKRKRASSSEAERGRVRVVQSELVDRLEAEISELKQDKAGLENEIDDINYQLKTQISDLKRSNKTLRDEVVNLRAVDVSLVEGIDLSKSPLLQSEKLIPLIAKLQNHVKHLEDPSRYVSADFEPSNETEKNLLSRINQLKILKNTALNQQSAFLASMQQAQGEKEAFRQQAAALQETNTRVQDDLRKLQHRVETLQKSHDESDTLKHVEKGLSPEFRSISAQTDGEDVVSELKNLRENISRIESELEEAKEQSEVFRKARDKVAIVLKTKKEEHETEKEQYAAELQQAAEQECVLRDEKSSIELQLANANQKIQESQDQVDKLSQLRQELLLLRAERDMLKTQNEQLVELKTANSSLKESNCELSRCLKSVKAELAQVKTAELDLDNLKKQYECTLEQQRREAAEDLAIEKQNLQDIYDAKLSSVLQEKTEAEREVEKLQTSSENEIERLQKEKNGSDSRASFLEKRIASLQAQHEQDILKSKQAEVKVRAEATRLQNESEQLEENEISIHELERKVQFLQSQTAQDLLETKEQLQKANSETQNAQAAHTAINNLLEKAKQDLSEANATRDVTLSKLADENKLVFELRSSYRVLESQHQACRGEIETLKRDANDKISQASGVVRKYREDLTQANVKIQNAENSLKEKAEEVARLQEEVARLKVILFFTCQHKVFNHPRRRVTAKQPQIPQDHQASQVLNQLTLGSQLHARPLVVHALRWNFSVLQRQNQIIEILAGPVID
ncbi:hypothetical protein VKT23_013671 [Stygiomarasmius scandens]|uniref:Uncharacterized protein n=1 Tax=Marasmiellus scandens TaxID=2682957 RepID=A0ABR1J2L8_9AGAR